MDGSNSSGPNEEPRFFDGLSSLPLLCGEVEKISEKIIKFVQNQIRSLELSPQDYLKISQSISQRLQF